MGKDYKIETVKKETRGVWSPETRVTSRDSEGQIATSKFRSTEAEATQESRERLSAPQKKEKNRNA
jgi:hypothetical protein